MPTLSIPLQHTGQVVDAHGTGFTADFRIGERLVNNVRYDDDIVLVASSKTVLQEFVTKLHVTW